MLRKLFRRMTGRPADSFDQVEYMQTRKLPIPDLDGTDKFVQFMAKRTKEGYWDISSKNNMKNVTTGFQLVQEAFGAAMKKHAGAPFVKGQGLLFNFDTTFLVLRDMEEALLKYNGTVAKDEPEYHYMAAYRVLPRQFQEGLDDLLLSRTDKSGEILTKKPPEQKALPAHKTPGMPKPN